MRIGLISDTHDNLVLTKVAVEWLRKEAPARVFHLGDITMPECASMLAGLPVVFLKGNNDESDTLRDGRAEPGLPSLLDTWTGEVDGVRIGATHGHVRTALAKLVRDHDIVLHGHTHRARAEQIGRALVINPGALHRAPVKTVAMLDVATRQVTFYVVSESGVRPFV